MSSKKENTLYDPVRKKWVENTPEETIRQLLIRQMTEKLGYPLALLAVEKELSQLPHLKLTHSEQIAKRRADLIVFSKATWTPLLLVECKAVALTPQFAQQVIGYNCFVQAPFIALANEKQVMTGYYDLNAGIYRFERGLAAYLTLLDLCRAQTDRLKMIEHFATTDMHIFRQDFSD